MTSTAPVGSDEIRSLFSRAMSEMYRAEVPQYGTLMSLVAEVNEATLEAGPDLAEQLRRAGELGRLSDERHGAIRLGTAAELATIARLFAVMGMAPVGYYDLSVAGIPVHSTAFRPLGDAALAANPFRVFTSLLRLDLVADEALRAEAAAILSRRAIFTPGAIELIETAERQGGLTRPQAERFVREALETFRWHSEATVDRETYERLASAHRLVADVVCFKGPHINHLTPRTLDIEAVQRAMPERGIEPKAVIEGPPERRCPVLLRQTSFKALEEPIRFLGEGAAEAGRHSARFGEIEQRGVALTPEGRAIYDALLSGVRGEVRVDAGGGGASDYAGELAARFHALPDDWNELRGGGLAFFRYAATPAGLAAATRDGTVAPLEDLVAAGHVAFDPIVYEDFLPVSAAGIFQSNLGSDAQANAAGSGNRAVFEAALGQPVHDEIALYAAAQATSIERALAALSAAPRRAVA
ncbi:2-oxoadipate dioxygenase/decarboxylase HglS [Aureimonas pseudogalii]|uniref:2-oxoadipate dioxygenase/decarboxylase n=1 Tax=Aureimonas pseudogalii TaxID=1744844 RepID=A0A7W6H6B7_9HYPH|nr:VOC family protein [Aureimonas pseudogalii]MBB3999363.1 putative glyoxalase superfamily metalloenzyme YdcJ [Aureimonas pseudogalii]